MKRALFLISVLLLMPLSSVLAAKPEPPNKLIEIFSDVLTIENSLGKEDWSRARNTATEIEKLLAETGSSIKSTVGNQTYEQLKTLVSQVQAALANKDKESTESRLIELQKGILSLMSAYNYPVHPVFSIIARYVEEGIEAAETADHSRVVHEMTEIANFVSSSNVIISQNGIGKGLLSDFQDQLFAVLAAAQDKNKQQEIKALGELKNTVELFQWQAARNKR